MKPLSFTLANFKSFGSKPSEIPLRPITLVFGPNSAGKSTLLQGLMYFHEALESGDLDVIVPRSAGGRVDLGGFKQVLHRRGGIRHLVFGFTYPLEILPSPDRNWWFIKKSFSINLTLGPLSGSEELGTRGVSLEFDGRELLRASRVEEGPMKIDLFDFDHPAMERLLATLTDRNASEPQDIEDELADEADRQYHRESLLEYFNFAILRGCFEL
ncbi:MAG: AAA family ATPase, partial [Candidatus Omnitrophica bacterium]|nr:AAA family ATPase [Candidatus Omnitrophota bacterium]